MRYCERVLDMVQLHKIFQAAASLICMLVVLQEMNNAC